MKRMVAIARKELRHILRDVRSLVVTLIMPATMVLLFGFGIDTELKDLTLGVLDCDQTEASRIFVRRMLASDFLIDAGTLASRKEVEPGFRRERFRAVLVVPRGFGASLTRGKETAVQWLIDGADATTAATVDNYLTAALGTINRERVPQGGIAARTRVLFNPELKSANFIVPGLVAVVLMMICALLTSIAITREKETGTMEQVLTTPVRPVQLIVGKVIPYLFIGIADAALVLGVGRLVFDVPMQGSWFVLSAYSFVYLLIALSFGLLISALVHTQRVAMMMALVATMLPTILLSGFIFPLASMPAPLQALGHIIPATYYLRVVRSLMLTGRVWFPLEAAVMGGMAVAFLAIAIRRFSTRLET